MKGHSYAYLVRNVWDKKNGRVRQEIVKYLGKSSKVALEDIPKEYQKDPNVVTFIACHSSDAEKKDSIMKEKMLELLIRNDTNSLIDIFERYSQFFGLVKFYERLLAPVMYKVGELWKAGKLNVATEHVCSNAAHTLVKIINERFSSNPVSNRKAHKILICTPEGEYHSLGCTVIESFLRSKGYCVFNIAPSVPSDAIITFAGKYNPDLIMISITLDENIGAANKLINKILESRISVPPILVGGIGIESMTIKSQNDKLKKVKFLKGTTLSGILPSVRVATKDGPKLNETIKK
ncbi:MAG TPA: cobalamin B12-binding domain-containing protein [Nitrososphaeraceae archaeon]|nr:cobalamin B12-binding domain-containing protein [Nitrososphaeraceae archaeon]